MDVIISCFLYLTEGNKYINVVCYMYVIIIGQSLKLLKKFPKSQFYRLSLGDITFKYHVQSVETSMLP